MIFKELSRLSAKEKRQIIDRGLKIKVEEIKDIVEEVKKLGDQALINFTERFDGVSLKSLRVGEEEFQEASKSADKRVVDAIETAYQSILEFHEKQVEKDRWYESAGKKLGQVIRPVEKVGCYIPGGKAFYPSTVLMAAVPAKVAGVKRIICTTPPGSDGNVNEYTLLTCKIARVDEVYKVGGAQAIAALAYGTETIPKVDMIVGPGNIYVTAAKKYVYGEVGIDMLAGPSEVLILADSSGDPGYIAADILAQAEHDPNASCVLVTTERDVAKSVKERLSTLSSPEGLKNTSILIANNFGEAIEFSNEYGPEHLEIITRKDEEVLKKVVNAGSIFLGNYSPVAAGDYAAGPNHILPTGGCARFQSGLNVGHFLKKISVQRLSKETLEEIGETISLLAEAEGLIHHSESIKKRLKR